MRCHRTNKPVFTGLERPASSRIRDYANHRFTCIACGRVHAVRSPYLEENGPTLGDQYWVALDNVPEIAAEVGIIVSIFWAIEFSMPRILQKLTGMRPDDATMVMGYFKSFSDKVELLKLLIKNRSQKDALCVQITTLLPRLAQANSLRNKYVHARFSIGINDLLHLAPFEADARRKPTEEKKTLEDVVEETQIMREIAQEAHHCAYGQ